MRDEDRKLHQEIFLRVCKDSGFKMTATDAAIFAAEIIKSHALLVWAAFSDLGLMERLADGTHPYWSKQ